MMDIHHRGFLFLDEVSVLRGRDKERFVEMLDLDREETIGTKEWNGFLAMKKKELGTTSFQFFLSFLEVA